MVQQPRMYRRTIGTRYQVRFERYAMFAGTAIPPWILTGTAWHPPDGWEVEERFLFDVQYDREDEYDDGDEDADSPEEADECVEERHLKMIATATGSQLNWMNALAALVRIEWL
jgi:hypothetical protein